MSTLVHQLTVDQFHKEFNSLVEKILAEFEQLDSGDFGAVGTPAFNAKSAELVVLFAHMSQLCLETKPAGFCTFTQATILQTLKSTFLDQNFVW